MEEMVQEENCYFCSRQPTEEVLCCKSWNQPCVYPSNWQQPTFVLISRIRNYLDDFRHLNLLHMFLIKNRSYLLFCSPITHRYDLPAKPGVVEEARSAPAVPTSTQAEKPAEVPTAVTTHAEPPAELASPEIVAPEPEPSEPAVTKRKRGHPPGSKNKPRVYPNCTTSAACVEHCKNCKEGLACNLHTAAQWCSKCTRTRLCTEHA